MTGDPEIFTFEGALGSARYAVRFAEDPLARGDVLRATAGRRALLVTTAEVMRLYGDGIASLVVAAEGRVATLVIPSGEPSKQFASVELVAGKALEVGLGRNGMLIAVGGGVCSDIVTVAASLIRRGLRHIRVPTTLVGQVDAGIGVKAAVNFRDSKSALGCFHAPSEVLIDPFFLRTLPAPELRAGLAEVVKMAVVGDRRLFELVEGAWPTLLKSGFEEPAEVAREVIRQSATRMLEALASNPLEASGRPRAVDAGHTFSPRLEAATGFEIRHGEAVAVDLVLTATIATLLGLLPLAECERIASTIAAIGLPVASPLLSLELCSAAVEDAVRHRGGHLNLPLPSAIGEVTVLKQRGDLSTAVLEEALAVVGERARRIGVTSPPGAEGRRQATSGAEPLGRSRERRSR